MVPPKFNELPKPKNKNAINQNSNENDQKSSDFEKLIKKKDDITIENESINNGNLEESILKQINK